MAEYPRTRAVDGVAGGTFKTQGNPSRKKMSPEERAIKAALGPDLYKQLDAASRGTYVNHIKGYKRQYPRLEETEWAQRLGDQRQWCDSCREGIHHIHFG